jgi:DNA-binding NarL/FixJ family response regulator
MITAGVADDQRLIRGRGGCPVGAEPHVSIVGTAADGAEVPGLIGSPEPGVALTALRMPDTGTGGGDPPSG